MVLDQFKLRLVLPTPSRVGGGGVPGYSVVAAVPESPGSVGDLRASDERANPAAASSPAPGAPARASLRLRAPDARAGASPAPSAPSSPRTEARGKIVRYTADGVLIRLEGETHVRVVPIDGRVIVGFVGAFNGNTLKPDRPVKVVCDGVKVVRMEPG